jgi:hypothetical protein
MQRKAGVREDRKAVMDVIALPVSQRERELLRKPALRLMASRVVPTAMFIRFSNASE